jgi:hypothetical protein
MVSDGIGLGLLIQIIDVRVNVKVFGCGIFVPDAAPSPSLRSF